MAQLKTLTGFYTEKGISAKARKSLKDQALARVLYATQADEMMADARYNVNGGISIPLCYNEKGEVVYARLDLVITTDAPDVKKVAKKTVKKSATAEEVDYTIFGD